MKIAKLLIGLLVVAVCLLVVPKALSQGGNPPASTKESGATSGRGYTAVEQTGASLAGEKTAAKQPAANMGVYTPDQLRWGAAPDVLPAGSQLAVVEGDPTKPGPYTMRLKMPAGYKIAPHHHARREHVTVMSGEFKVGMGDKFDESKMNSFSPGSFAWLEPAVHHYAMAATESVIQLHGTGPWEIIYINPSDDPRNVKR